MNVLILWGNIISYNRLPRDLIIVFCLTPLHFPVCWFYSTPESGYYFSLELHGETKNIELRAERRL
jgi:hypothetical protein